MGRDKILGLSLAILVIGFAGAFCFRNEQIVQDGLKLAREKILDDAIAERPGPKPYAADPKAMSEKPSPPPAVTLKGIESIDSVAQTDAGENNSTTSATTTQTTATEKSAPSETSIDPFDDISDSKPKSVEKVAVDDPSLKSNVRPEEASPPPTADVMIRPKTLVPSRQTPAWQPIAAQRERRALASAAEDDPALKTAAIVHRVKQGDTLTKIAHQYLGDGGRYLEIYSANRDQLHTPDDRLRIGMVLRIPRTSKQYSKANGPIAGRKLLPYRSAVSSGATRTRSAPIRNVSRTRRTPPPTPPEAPATTATAPNGSSDLSTSPGDNKGADDDSMSTAPKDRFMPVRRSPFLPSSSRSNSPAGRSLSQQPPDDAPKENSQQETTPPEGSPDMSYRYFPKSGSVAITLERDRDEVQRR